MEGLPSWFLVTVMAVFGLMWLSGLPALAALGFLLAGRWRKALIWFASALLCEAILGAAFYLVVAMAERQPIVPIVVTGLSLLVAGVGQLVAAIRNPRVYAVALPLGVVAVLVIVVGVPVFHVHHSRVPEWDSLPLIVISLALAVAGLLSAVLLPVRARRKEEVEAV